MKRRQFVFAAATLGLLTGCGVLPNLGRTPTRSMWRVGILTAIANSGIPTSEIAGLKHGLGELGYVEGRTVAFELRDSDINFERLPELAAELIQLPVHVLVALQSPAVLAAHQATTIVPIIFVGPSDPVGKGWVASLAHPGGNLTGVYGGPTPTGKLIEYLAQLVPGVSHIAFFASLDPADPSLGPSTVQLATSEANALGVQLKPLDVRTPEDVEPALTEALAWHADALIASGGVAIVDALSRFVDFQLQNRIPFVSSSKEWVQAGGLLSYGASFMGQGRQAATFVDKILKGAQPADLPVEEADTFELIINQTTAQALGISITPEVAQQVTEWMQ